MVDLVALGNGIEARKESLKLLMIGIFAVISLLLTVYIIQNPGNTQFTEVYRLLPHLYLIPLILVALWYPKRGLQIMILLISSIVILTMVMFLRGMEVNPVSAILNTGLDIGIFVVLALYVKDRHLVDTFLRGFLEQNEEYRQALDEAQARAERAKVKFQGDFDMIVRALHSDDDDTREEAVRALCELGDPRGVDPLITALRDNSRYVRREAAKALGMLRSERALRPLIQALKDEDRYAREGAAEGLAELGESAVPYLLDALADADWHVRMGACISLRIIGDKRAVEPLMEALRDENRFVRREAVKSLGRIGDEKVVGALAASMHDEDSSVRIRAVGSLSKFSGPQVIDALISALNDYDSGVRLRAIQALEETRDPRGLEAVRNGIANGTGGPQPEKNPGGQPRSGQV